MDEPRREQIYNNLNSRETEDLIEIWQERNTDEWEEEVFEIIREILLARLGYLPPQSVQYQVKQILDKVDNYIQAGYFDQALSECELAIKLAPDLAIAYYYLGFVYDETGQLDKALSNYQEAIRLDPKLKDAWENLSIIDSELTEEFQHSASKQHLDLALAYAYSDEPEKGLEECELAKETMPNIAIAYNYLGMILEELEQKESAIDAYREAIRFNPKFYAARENLGNARVRQEEEIYLHNPLIDLNGEEVNEEDFPNYDEFQESDRTEIENPVPGWLYTEGKSFVLVGWPSHRTRPGRSGYDPLDTDFEHAHVGGVIIHKLLTRKFRTHNPIYLLIMTCLGCSGCCVSSLASIAALIGGRNLFWIFFIILPLLVIGISLLINVILSLGIKNVDEYTENGNAFF